MPCTCIGCNTSIFGRCVRGMVRCWRCMGWGLGDHRACRHLGGDGWNSRRWSNHDLRSLPWLRDDLTRSSLTLCACGRGFLFSWNTRLGCFRSLGSQRFFCLRGGRDRRWFRGHGNRRRGNGALGSLFFLLQHGLHHIARLGDTRQVDLRLRLRGCSLFRPGRGAFHASAVEERAYPLRLIVFQRTGMGLLLAHADLRQRVKNLFALDFQFACQIVDSNFTHPPLSPSSTPDISWPLPTTQNTAWRYCSHYPLKVPIPADFRFP